MFHVIHIFPLFNQLVNRQSRHGRRRKQCVLSPSDPVASGTDFNRLGSHPSLIKSGSSSTLTERNKSTPEPTPPPFMSPSRHTEEGSSFCSSSIPDKLRGKSCPSVRSLPLYYNEPPSCRPLIRQPSTSRIGPPSAPPAQALPAPPVRCPSIPIRSNPHSRESSSSSLSFASAVSTHTHRECPSSTIPGHTGTKMNLQDEPCPSTMKGRHIVKRSISHQALPKRRSQTGLTASPIQSEETSPGRSGLRKQRSFHSGSRLTPQSLPPPPVPIPPRQSLSSSEQHDTPSSHPVEFVRKSTTVPARKRLFSGGSNMRPPSSVLLSGEDDCASVLSGESELVSFISPFTTDSPQRDDHHEPPTPTSPSTASMSFAQKIVSPEELLRIEASFNDLDPFESGIPKRQRAQSSASVLTPMTGLERFQIPDSPRHYVVEQGSNFPGRHGSCNHTSETGSLRNSNLRINMNLSIPATPSQTHASPSPPQGLPPPPRRRTVNSDRDPRLSSAPSTPTSTGLPPPPRRKTSNVSNRPRGIMKKPSFFDIEYSDFNQRRTVAPASRFVDNFLDLDKGKDSFDVTRGEDNRR